MTINEQAKIGNLVRVEGRSNRIPEIVFEKAIGEVRYLETICEIAMAQIAGKGDGRAVLLSALHDASGQQVEIHDTGTGFAIPALSTIDGKTISEVNASVAFRLLARLVLSKGWTEIDIWLAVGPTGKPVIPDKDIVQVAFALTVAGCRVNFELSPDRANQTRTSVTRTVTSPHGMLPGVSEPEIADLIDAAREVTAGFLVPHWLRSETDDVSRSVGVLIATFPMLDHATVSRELSRYDQPEVLKAARHLLANTEIGAFLPFRTIAEASLPERFVEPAVEAGTRSAIDEMLMDKMG